MRVGSVLKMDRIEILAALAGLFFAFIATFIGVIAIPFAGTGPTGYLRILSILLGFELPAYVVCFFISRKVLMYVCWSMFVIDDTAEFLFHVTETGFPASILGKLMIFLLDLVPWVNLLGILIPLLATYLYREEKRRLAGDWS